MVVILVEEEKLREMLVLVVGVVDRSPSPNPHQERKGYNKPHPNHLHQEEGVFSNCLKYSKKELLPLGRALKNYRYFHFIGVVRRHYRAFTRHSGYDVW